MDLKYLRKQQLQQKCEHFLDFLFNNKLLQDVEFSVTNLKFVNGDRQKIAYAMSVTKYSHTISFYLKACKNSDYNSLSKSSLWRILASIKPSKRKSLRGLDNLTASGINGFETIIKLASKYRIERTTTETIQNGTTYLKTNYQMQHSILKGILKVKTIPDFSQFHSVEYFDDGMRFW